MLEENLRGQKHNSAILVKFQQGCPPPRDVREDFKQLKLPLSREER